MRGAESGVCQSANYRGPMHPTFERYRTLTRLVAHPMGEPVKGSSGKFAFFAAFECPACGLVTFVLAVEVSGLDVA